MRDHDGNFNFYGDTPNVDSGSFERPLNPLWGPVLRVGFPSTVDPGPDVFSATTNAEIDGGDASETIHASHRSLIVPPLFENDRYTVGYSISISTDQEFIGHRADYHVSTPASGYGLGIASNLGDTSGTQVLAGFDTSSYPAHGISTMDWLIQNTNLREVGYYLAPAPSRSNATWMGHRAELVADGWTIAPIYVGEQDENSTSSLFSKNPSASKGTTDGNSAASLLSSEGFSGGTVVYLDIETGSPLSSREQAYLSNWCVAVAAHGFVAGVYCPGSDATTVSSLVPNARLWVADLTMTATPGTHTFPTQDPSGSGHSNATGWQYQWNYTISTINGPLNVDLDTFSSSVPLQADLLIDDLTPTTTTFVQGTGLSFSAHVRNAGGASATNSFSTIIYLSGDDKLYNPNDSNDHIIETFTTSSLAGGQSVQFANSVPVSSSVGPGSYYLGIYTDYGNTNSESREDNNSFAYPTQITVTAPDTIPPSQTHKSSLSVANGGTGTITPGLLQFDDNVSSHGQENYTVITAPGHGALLKGGVATTAFTQSDIDNGLITYHENGDPVSSDSIMFKVTDAAGNQTAAQQFFFNIGTAPDTTPPSQTHKSPLSVANGGTGTITPGLLQFDDNVSSHGQENYTVIAAPGHGALLKGGVATTAFTQTDIDNGLITYHENGDPVSSDSIMFKVTDAAGNQTAAQQFFFNIGTAPDTMPPSLTHESPLSVAIGGTGTITPGLLQFDDDVSSHGQENYTVITAPGHGALLKGGVATTAFTQTDIDNGLITYHENGDAVSSDSIMFKVTDAAGNQTAAQQFLINIGGAQPELAISNFSLASPLVAAGGKESISFAVVNSGNAPAAATTNNLYLSTDATIDSGDTLIFTIGFPAASPDTTTNTGFNYAVPSGLAPGTYYIGLVIDANNDVPNESNEANNSAVQSFTVTSVTLPDLAISMFASAPATLAAGDAESLGYSIINAGNVAAGATTTKLYISTDAIITSTDTLIDTISTPALAAGALSSGSFSYTIPAGFAPGTYYIGILADANNDIPNEVSETNNTSSHAFTITGGPLPDFSVTNFNLSGMQAHFTVDNFGSGPAATAVTGVYLSVDGTITTSDTLLGTSSTPALASGATDGESVGFALPTSLTPGTYYLGAVADANASVQESNEANNASDPFAIILGNDSGNSLSGTSSADSIFALGGNDTLAGGAGGDHLDGGAGTDTASYSAASAGVTVYLDGSGTNTGEAAGDTFNGVENLLGSAFADTLVGTSGVNLLQGGDGNDSLWGYGGGDTLDGGNGNDYLVGRAGADTFIGGAGSDTVSYFFAASGVTAYLGGGGSNTGEAAGDTFNGVENLLGSAFADTLVGTGGVNLLQGGDGNDSLWGYGGGDTLDGGNGNDYLVGAAGADTFIGGAGSDTASYNFAATGVTVYLDGSGTNTGEAAGDTFNGVENLLGSAFADTLVGTGGVNLLQGGDGNDSLWGYGGGDTLDGGNGNDYLVGRAGGDTFIGGAGTDTASYNFAATGVTVYLDGSGTNTGEAAGDTFNGVENLLGSAFADTLVGTGGVNLLQGGDGNDSLWGYGGGDTLDGGNGNDYLVGRAGGDTFIGGAGTDTASYNFAATGVTVYLDGSGTNTGEAAGDTFNGVENLLGSAFADTLVGTGGVNLLQGGDGNDSLWGYGGGDTLDGGNGNDYLVGRAGADTFIGGAGSDTVSYFFAASGVTVHLDGSAGNTGEAAGDTFNGVENLLGSAFADTLVGTSGANVLQGAGGNDTMTGGAGDDHFLFVLGDGRDTITDFSAGDASGDVIDLHGYGVTAFSALSAHMSQVGADVLIDLDAQNQITLQHVTLAQLNAGDFLLS